MSRLDMVLVRTSVQWRELSIALMRARAGMVAAMHGPRGSPGPVAVKGLTAPKPNVDAEMLEMR